MQCSICQTYNEAGDRFCSRCGEPLSGDGSLVGPPGSVAPGSGPGGQPDQPARVMPQISPAPSTPPPLRSAGRHGPTDPDVAVPLDIPLPPASVLVADEPASPPPDQASPAQVEMGGSAAPGETNRDLAPVTPQPASWALNPEDETLKASAFPDTDVIVLDGGGVAELRFIQGELAGRSFPLNDDEVTVGRRPGCTIQLHPKDLRSSGRHARLVLLAEGFAVEDLGSSNGTFLNDEELEPEILTRLHNGDTIRFGKQGPCARYVLNSKDELDKAGIVDEEYAIILHRQDSDRPDERYKFRNQDLVILGRSPASDLPFREQRDRKVSAQHARLRFLAGEFILEDMDSKNGTFLNGERIRAMSVRRGDRIELGPRGPRFVVEAIHLPDALRRTSDKGGVGRRTMEMALARIERRGVRQMLILTVVFLAVLAGGSVVAYYFLTSQAETIASQEEQIEQQQEEQVAIRKQQEALDARLNAERELLQRLVSDSRRDLAALRMEYQAFKEDQDRRLREVAASDRERFQQIEQQYDPAAVLIHARFRIMVEGEATPLFSGEGWGTGFVVSQQGHAVTNKHVIQPWKAEPQYAFALRHIEESFGAEAITVVSDISCWPAETRAFSEDGGHNFATSFNNHERSNLKVIGLPSDTFQEVLFSESPMRLKVLAYDNNDLALLQLEGLHLPAERIPRLLPSTESLRKLDPVMTLGFPLGKQVLEGQVARTSPSMGHVHKVEQTVQVTAPILPGNSGGPLFVLDGRVAGVTTRSYGDNAGESECIPIEAARALLKAHGVQLPPE